MRTSLLPDERGYYGEFGGRFVPETIMPALDELISAFHEAWSDRDFRAEYHELQAQYVGPADAAELCPPLE